MAVANILEVPSDAYFAGHFDGEGSLTMLSPRRHARPLLRIAVTSAHLPTLELYRSRFGGGVKKSGRSCNKPLYCWHISATHDMRYFLARIEPFSLEKREQVKVALQWLNYKLSFSPRSRAQELKDESYVVQSLLKQLRATSYPYL